MAILKVARMGHPILRRVADPIPVEHITSPEVQGLIRDMLDTVVEYDGVGLAAPQVHHSVRLVLLALDPEEGFEAWINPILTPTTEEEMITTEGCLSVPSRSSPAREPWVGGLRAAVRSTRSIRASTRAVAEPGGTPDRTRWSLAG